MEKNLSFGLWLPLWYKDLQDHALECSLENALEFLGSSVQEWITLNPLFLSHPRTTVDPNTLGMHQDWTTNLQAFREVSLRDGTTIYLFQFHIDALISELVNAGIEQKSFHFVLT